MYWKRVLKRVIPLMRTRSDWLWVKVLEEVGSVGARRRDSLVIIGKGGAKVASGQTKARIVKEKGSVAKSRRRSIVWWGRVRGTERERGMSQGNDLEFAYADFFLCSLMRVLPCFSRFFCQRQKILSLTMNQPSAMMSVVVVPFKLKNG